METYSTLEEMFADIERDAKTFRGRLRRITYRVMAYPPSTLRALRDGYERARKGYSRNDWWRLHWYLPMMLVGSLTDLRDNNHGAPWMLDIPIFDADEALLAHNRSEWERILTEMIVGFEAAVRLADGTSTDEPADRASAFDAYTLLAEHHDLLWD